MAFAKHILLQDLKFDEMKIKDESYLIPLRINTSLCQWGALVFLRAAVLYSKPSSWSITYGLLSPKISKSVAQRFVLRAVPLGEEVVRSFAARIRIASTTSLLSSIAAFALSPIGIIAVSCADSWSQTESSLPLIKLGQQGSRSQIRLGSNR